MRLSARSFINMQWGITSASLSEEDIQDFKTNLFKPRFAALRAATLPAPA
jgi:hypothetical protein